MAKMTKMRKKVAKKGSAAGAGKTGASPKKAAVNRGAINKKNKVVSRKDRKSKFLDRGSPPPSLLRGHPEHPRRGSRVTLTA